MSPTQPLHEIVHPIGVVAVGRDDADAYRAASFDVFELDDPWAWLAMTESERSATRARQGALTPDSPLDPAFASWCSRRPVLVDLGTQASPVERHALETMMLAIRVQTSASIVRGKKWSN